MSKLSNLIFKNGKHYLTSPYGKREAIKTSAGTTETFHSGTDYGTSSVKLPQYAVANGYVFAAQKATDGALYVWLVYPELKVAMIHYHLNSYVVKKGQKVQQGTLIGYTGKTGKATGIHLHLGIRDLSKQTATRINAMTWDTLRNCPYIDPEKYEMKEYNDNKSYLPARGYFAKGDKSATVGKIAEFMRKNFPAYTSEKALGNTYGSYIIASIKEFQKRTGLKADGYLGILTLEKLFEYGLKL